MPFAGSPSASSIAWANSGPDRDGAGLARPLDAERIERRRRHRVGKVHARHVERGRQQVVGERGVEQLPSSSNTSCS